LRNYKGYKGSFIRIPVYDFLDPPSDNYIGHTSNEINLPKVEEPSTSAVGVKHPAGCSPRVDRTTKNATFSMCMMANGY